MTPDLSYEELKPFWPKCSLCGLDLGDSSLEVNTGLGKRRICPECMNIIVEVVKLELPYILGELLNTDRRKLSGNVDLLSINQIKAEAAQKMRES